MAVVVKKYWDTTLMWLSILFLIAYSYPAFFQTISPNEKRLLNTIQLVAWLAFVIDYALSIFKSENKIKYIKKHPLDLLAITLPFLRPLRLLRFISFGTLVFDRVNLSKSISVSAKVVITTLFLTYLAAVEITLTERESASASIQNFGDGLWWAMTTLTTVGYGDLYPTTTQGKFIAVGLMIAGICMLSVISATIVAWFVKFSEKQA